VDFAAKIARYVRRHQLIVPGERIGVAVSGGADSVALLRALLELRRELGCVLAVAHFNHKIRPEADADAEFVESLAGQQGLEIFGSSGDAKSFAAERRVSLETAARELRYQFFSSLSFDKIATAHTLDDQAETVLMKVLRGAGTKGMSGIWPCVSTRYPVPSTQRNAARRSHPFAKGAKGWGTPSLRVIRPMLGVRRREVEAYLRSLGQEWREDASNRDVKHTRNKVRHEMLPLLEHEYNPNIYQQLADAAEVARGEEEYWAEVLSTQYSVPSIQERQSPRHGPSTSVAAATSARDDNFLHVETLAQQPLALRRRVVRAAFEQATGKALDFEHTDALVRFLERRESSMLQLPERWFAVLDWPRRTVSFEERMPLRRDGTATDKSPSKAVSKKRGKLAGRKV
jgi:tRNA(Ile)-lysidine synthase